MLYAILPRADWDGLQPVHETGGAILVHFNALHERVDELSGRPGILRTPSIARKLRSYPGRVYIARSRAMGGGGFLVENVNTSRK